MEILIIILAAAIMAAVITIAQKLKTKPAEPPIEPVEPTEPPTETTPAPPESDIADKIDEIKDAITDAVQSGEIDLVGDYEQYTIKRGDTLSAVAEKYGIAVEALMECNGYSWAAARDIAIGTVIRVPLMRPRYPINYVGVSVPFSRSHPAVDFGWASKQNGGLGHNAPIVAPCKLTIKRAFEGDGSGKTIYAWAAVNGEDVTLRFIHLSTITCKVGDVLNAGEQLGAMGATGTECDGEHLHFDVWRGHVKSMPSDRYSVSIDPLEWCYLAAGQTVGDTTDKKYQIKRA